jgi:hypothetical protein
MLTNMQGAGNGKYTVEDFERHDQEVEEKIRLKVAEALMAITKTTKKGKTTHMMALA